MCTEKSEIFVGPDEGAYLPVLDIVHKVSARASGGSLKIEEWGLPPGEMIPPHTHAREDESSFVLEGELTCYVGGAVMVAPERSYVLKPRGVPHAFYNSSAGIVGVMEILTPGDSFEGYFDEYEEIMSRKMSDEEHRMARAELGERYGIIWHDERISELRTLFEAYQTTAGDERKGTRRDRAKTGKSMRRAPIVTGGADPPSCPSNRKESSR